MFPIGPAVNAPAEVDPFNRPSACFEDLVGWLEGTEAAALAHAQLKEQIDLRRRELLRRMHQAELDLRASREHSAEVIDADGVRHGGVETGHTRGLSTLFGAVHVTRLAYRHRWEHQPVPSRRYAQRSPRSALPRDQAAGCGRVRLGIVRRVSSRNRAGDRHPDRQTPGGIPDRAGRHRRRRLLRHPAATTWRRPRPAGDLRGRQGHRDAARLAAPGHRSQGSKANSGPACPRGRSATASDWPRSARPTTGVPPTLRTADQIGSISEPRSTEPYPVGVLADSGC